MGSVLSVSVVSCALVWSALATHDGLVCNDVLMEVLLFLPGCDLNSARLTSSLWRRMVLSGLARRSPETGTPMLCLDSAKIAHCAKWLRDENKDKGDQSAVLLTPMANVHFSFGEDDPVHPLGLHPCTVYSRAHPKGRHTMWQIPRQEWTQYPDLLEILLTEPDTPDAPCQQCRLTEQVKLHFLMKLTVEKPTFPIESVSVRNDLGFNFLNLNHHILDVVQYPLEANEEDWEPKAVKDACLVCFHQKNRIPDLSAIAMRDPRFAQFKIMHGQTQCWRSGDVISQIFLSDTESIYQAVFDVDCHSIRLCWRDDCNTLGFRPSFEDHCIHDFGVNDSSYQYCTLTGKLLRKARVNSCAKCEFQRKNPTLIMIEDWSHLCVQSLPSDDPNFLCYGLYQRTVK